MFKDGQLSDVNDPYYVMKFSKNNNIHIKQIYNIYNHNCLNFLSSHEKTVVRLPLTLLHKNCVTNNISRSDYICNLFEKVRQVCSTEIPNILNILFDKKFYDMIKIISKHQYFLSFWARSFIRRYMCRFNIDDEIKQEIITLIDMDIATPGKIYEILGQDLYIGVKIWQQVLSFIKDTYNV
jgi:hypothetical protein